MKNKNSKKVIKSHLTKAQRSLCAQYAAMRAHLHSTFQSERTRDDKKAQKSAYRAYVKSAPKFVRVRFADDIRATLRSL